MCSQQQPFAIKTEAREDSDKETSYIDGSTEKHNLSAWTEDTLDVALGGDEMNASSFWTDEETESDPGMFLFFNSLKYVLFLIVQIQLIILTSVIGL